MAEPQSLEELSGKHAGGRLLAGYLMKIKENPITRGGDAYRNLDRYLRPG
jgi:hypothetical protein